MRQQALDILKNGRAAWIVRGEALRLDNDGPDRQRSLMQGMNRVEAPRGRIAAFAEVEARELSTQLVEQPAILSIDPDRRVGARSAWHHRACERVLIRRVQRRSGKNRRNR